MSKLLCDVKGCQMPAIADTLPTHGETEHHALRCRSCLLYDLRTDHFKDWKEAIQEETDYGTEPADNVDGGEQ